MKKNIFKNLIIIFTIFLFSIPTFAGQWGFDGIGTFYIDDSNNRVVSQWRWIDDNNNGIGFCYRFDQNGYVVTNEVVSGKFHVNELGQWFDENGPVQVYMSTKKRIFLNNNSATSEIKVVSPTIKTRVSTVSVATPSYTGDSSVINSTKRRIQKYEGNSDVLHMVGPIAKPPKRASGSNASLRIISKGKNKDLLKTMKREVPSEKYENKGSIDTIEIEEERDGVQPGKNLNKFVNVSTKFTSEVASTKIFGGSTWKHCMLLSGNDAYVKFGVKGYNYLTVEVAEQSHVVSDDNETYTYLEVFEDNESIATYDGFNDSDPEIIELYFDEKETSTIAFKLHVSGTYTTRKVYLRNGRLRKLRDPMESAYNAVKTELNEYGVLVRSTETERIIIKETTAEEESTTKKKKVSVAKKTSASTEGETTKESETTEKDEKSTSESAKQSKDETNKSSSDDEDAKDSEDKK